MHTDTHISPLKDSPFPSKPRWQAPAGSCDCHCHVFGPYDRFPLAADKTYVPPEAPAALYLRMLDTLGMDRGVLVQASACGLDNSAMLDALQGAPDRLRGVAVAPGGTPAGELRALRDRGVRGLRLARNLMPDGSQRYKNTVDIAALDSLLPAMRELEMHVQLWISFEQLGPLEPMIRAAGIPFVLDHIGRVDPTRGLQQPDFQTLCRLVGEGLVWVKLTPYRSSLAYPDHADMRPYHEHLVRLNPERMLWGSDWPHINLETDIPDGGHLLDLLADWTPDPATLRRILVDNPAALYGF